MSTQIQALFPLKEIHRDFAQCCGILKTATSDSKWNIHRNDDGSASLINGRHIAMISSGGCLSYDTDLPWAEFFASETQRSSLLTLLRAIGEHLGAEKFFLFPNSGGFEMSLPEDLALHDGMTFSNIDSVLTERYQAKRLGLEASPSSDLEPDEEFAPDGYLEVQVNRDLNHL